ncbi:hypothetical protein D3C78_972240 [compost metagenome]
MTLLAKLFEQLENEPEKSGICSEKAGAPVESVSMAKVAALAPAINDHRAAPAPPPAPAAPAPTLPTPAPAAGRAAEAASEPQRNAWTITRGGRPICRMVGAPCTRTEALAEARWRWPDADILES